MAFPGSNQAFYIRKFNNINYEVLSWEKRTSTVFSQGSIILLTLLPGVCMWAGLPLERWELGGGLGIDDRGLGRDWGVMIGDWG